MESRNLSTALPVLAAGTLAVVVPLLSLAQKVTPGWSPSDTIAVVAVIASAIVAVAAVFLQGYVTRRNARKEQKRADIRDLLATCHRFADLRLEYVEAATRSPGSDDEGNARRRMLTKIRHLEALVAILGDRELDEATDTLGKASGPKLDAALPDRDKVKAVYKEIQDQHGRIQAQAAKLYREL